jgi:hypothetical protein
VYVKNIDGWLALVGCAGAAPQAESMRYASRRDAADHGKPLRTLGMAAAIRFEAMTGRLQN